MGRPDLVEDFVQRLQPVRGVLRSLAIFDAEAANRLETELAKQLDELLRLAAARVASATGDVLEEKHLSLEDEDSSGAVHLLMRLKDQADALAGESDHA